MNIILPPIQYFYGNSDLRIWISNCKEYTPSRYCNSSIDFLPIKDMTDFNHEELYKLFDKLMIPKCLTK